VYNIPTIIRIPGKECRDLTTGHSTQFTCVYNASSNPNVTITLWRLNDKLLTHNTSHYTLITEYGVDDLDKVRSTLIISNAGSAISGTYTCWCEYNQSMIYENELFRSSSASVCLRVGAGIYIIALNWCDYQLQQSLNIQHSNYGSSYQQEQGLLFLSSW